VGVGVKTDPHTATRTHPGTDTPTPPNQSV
jgi:hypothetical protein